MPIGLNRLCKRSEIPAQASFLGRHSMSGSRSLIPQVRDICWRSSEQMVPKSVLDSKERVPPGFNNVQCLVLERRDAGNGAETRAVLSFKGAREGVVSWLAAPGPIGSLNFGSPDATIAVSLAMKDPRLIMERFDGCRHAGQSSVSARA